MLSTTFEITMYNVQPMWSIFTTELGAFIRKEIMLKIDIYPVKLCFSSLDCRLIYLTICINTQILIYIYILAT